MVCTHIDRHHVHNHIIINSTSLDCTRKFRNFWGSTWAIRRLNDKLCLEHGLSIVENPKPSRSHYGTWLGDDQRLSQQERLRRIIDEVLADTPQDFPDFLKKLEAIGVESTRSERIFGYGCRPETALPAATRSKVITRNWQFGSVLPDSVPCSPGVFRRKHRQRSAFW